MRRFESKLIRAITADPNASKTKFGKRLVRSLFPIVLIIVLAVVGSLGFIVYCLSRPTKRAYLVTPQSFSQIASPALKVTDESWTNRDGTNARGWLLKGSEVTRP
jgi:hypothetical protein